MFHEVFVVVVVVLVVVLLLCLICSVVGESEMPYPINRDCL